MDNEEMSRKFREIWDEHHSAEFQNSKKRKQKKEDAKKYLEEDLGI